MNTFINIFMLTAIIAGAMIGVKVAKADDVQTSWGNLKCRYTPSCSNTNSHPVDDPGDKNQG